MPCLEGVISLTELENGFRFMIVCVELLLTFLRNEVLLFVLFCVLCAVFGEKVGRHSVRKQFGVVYSNLIALSGCRSWALPFMMAVIPLTTAAFTIVANYCIAAAGIDSREPIFATRITREDKLQAALRNLGKIGRVVDVRGTGTTVFYFEGSRLRLPFGVRCNRRTFLGVYAKWLKLPSERRRMLCSGVFDLDDIDFVCQLFCIAWEPWMLEACSYEASDFPLMFRLSVAPIFYVLSWFLILVQAYFEEIIKESELVPGSFAAFEFFTRSEGVKSSLFPFFVHFLPQYLGFDFRSRWVVHVFWNILVSFQRGQSIFWHLPHTKIALPSVPAALFGLPSFLGVSQSEEFAYYTARTLGEPRVLAAFLGEVQSFVVLLTSGNKVSAVASLASLLAKTRISLKAEYVESVAEELSSVFSNEPAVAEGTVFLGFEDRESVKSNLASLFPQDVRHSPQAIALVSILSLMISNEIGCERSQLLAWLVRDLKKRDGWSSAVADIKTLGVLVTSLLDFMSGKRDSFFDVTFYREFASFLEISSKIESSEETSPRLWFGNYLSYSRERTRLLQLPKMTNDLKLEISRVNARVEERGRKILCAGFLHELSTVGNSHEMRTDLYRFYRDVPLELRDHVFSRSLSDLEKDVEKDRIGRLASLPAFPIILFGSPGTGKTTMCGEIAVLLRKSLGDFGETRSKPIFSVALDDNGWEGFPLHGANVVLFNDLPGVLDRTNKALQERSLASEIRTLVDVEQLRPHLAFEPTSSTIGKGSTILCDSLAITTNARTLKFDVDTENLARRFNRGVVCEVSYAFQGRKFTYEEVQALDWTLEEKLARRIFHVGRAVCKGNFVSFQVDANGLSLHEGEFVEYVGRRFREHRTEAERELEVFSNGTLCENCFKPRSQHISYHYDGGKAFHQRLDCSGAVLETIPLSFESRFVSLVNEVRLWNITTQIFSACFLLFCMNPWQFALCFFALLFLLGLIGFAAFRVLVAHSGVLATISDFSLVCYESWRVGSWRMLADYCKRLTQARYVAQSIENWSKILAILLGGGLAAYFIFRTDSPFSKTVRKKESLRQSVEPFMQTSKTFSTPADITYVGVDRVQLLRHVDERYWDNVPRDATFSIVNAAEKKLPPDVLVAKSQNSVFKIKIRSALSDGNVISNSAFAVSLSVNRFLVLRHYFLNSFGYDYDVTKEYEILADFGGGFIPLRKVRNPLSASCASPELIVLSSNVVLPCPIINYLPKERLRGSFSGHYFLKESCVGGVDRFDEDSILMAMNRVGDNQAILETFVGNFAAGKGDCGSLLIAPLSDEVSVVAGVLCAGQFLDGVCMRTHFIPLSRSLFSEVKPLGLPPTIERCLNLGPFSVQSVAMNGRFEQLGFLGTQKNPQNNSMRTAFRRTEMWSSFQAGDDFWCMRKEYLPPPRETYGIVGGKKIGPMHYHLKNNIDCIWTSRDLFQSKGVRELVNKIHSEVPELDLGPISFQEALNGSRELGLSSFDASKSVGPSAKLELSIKDRRDILNDAADSFTPEFEQLLLDRFRELSSDEIFVPRIVAGADKDELRPAEKIAVFKIRWFFAADLHDQLWEKVLFFPIVRYCALRVDIFRWVANLNAVSPQWEALYRELEGKGRRGIDGDFVSFGASKSAEVASLISLVFSELLDHFKGYSQSQKSMMVSMVRDSVYQIILSRGDVLLKVRGDCDGSWLTLFINSFTNLVLWVWAFRECEPSLEYFEETAGRFQGDDNIHTLSERVRHFDAVSAGKKFLEIGYQYTAVDKSDAIVPLRDLDELTFLKRNFAKHDDLGIVGQLEVDSIVKSLAYYRKGAAPKYEVMRQCARSALMEAVLYGKSRFDELQSKLHSLYKEHKLGTCVALSYEEELARYRSFGSAGLS